MILTKMCCRLILTRATVNKLYSDMVWKINEILVSSSMLWKNIADIVATIFQDAPQPLVLTSRYLNLCSPLPY